MDGNAAGRLAGDAAADGRDSSNLWGSGAAGILAPATSGTGVALGDDCSAAGSGDIGSSRAADPALACSGTWPAAYPAGMVDDFLSRSGDCAGDAGAHRDLSSGSSGRGTDAQRLTGGDGGDLAVVAGQRAIWILRAARAVQRGVWRACGGHRIDGVDAAVGGDHISGGGVECGIGREPAGGARTQLKALLERAAERNHGTLWLNNWFAWSAIRAIRRKSGPCASCFRRKPWRSPKWRTVGTRPARLIFGCWQRAETAMFCGAMTRRRYGV